MVVMMFGMGFDLVGCLCGFGVVCLGDVSTWVLRADWCNTEIAYFLGLVCLLDLGLICCLRMFCWVLWVDGWFVILLF